MLTIGAFVLEDVIIIVREAEAPYPCDTAYFCLPTSLRLPDSGAWVDRAA